MTGRLQFLRRQLSAIGDDLSGGTAEERATATVLRGINTAMAVGALPELAALVKPWMDGKIIGGLQGAVLDDQSREDAISGLRADTTP